MKVSNILSVTLLLMGFFSLLHTSFRLDLNRDHECDEDSSIPECNVKFLKIYALLILSIFTIVIGFLQIFQKPSLFILNAVVGAISLFCLFIYFIALLVN